MWFRALRVSKKKPHPKSLPGDQFSIFLHGELCSNLSICLHYSHIVSHETVCWTEKSKDQRNMEILLDKLFLHCNMFSIAIRQWPHFNGISSTFAHFLSILKRFFVRKSNQTQCEVICTENLLFCFPSSTCNIHIHSWFYFDILIFSLWIDSIRLWVHYA